MSTITPAAGLSQPQIRALNALVTGSSVTKAAEAAAVHRCTVHSWCRGHKVFRVALEETKKIHAQTVLDHYCGLVESAAEALREIIEDPETPKGVRLKAALAVMNTVAAASQSSQEEDRYLLDPALDSEPEIVAPAAQKTPATDAFHPDAPCPCGSGQRHQSCCGHFFVDLPSPRAA